MSERPDELQPVFTAADADGSTRLDVFREEGGSFTVEITDTFTGHAATLSAMDVGRLREALADAAS